jgi:hypothetical protein
MQRELIATTFAALLLGLAGCAGEEAPLDLSDDPFWTDDGAADSFRMGMPDPGWEVWEPVHAWTDPTAPNGETWEQYYATWLATVEADDDGRAVQYVLADGRVVPAPSLECADTALFLRFLFAEQHGLPMYVRGWVHGGWAYFGHFGWIGRDGTRQRNYRQHPVRGELGGYAPLQAANRYLPDNLQGYPRDGATIGEYLDAVLENKRLGFFMQDLWNMIYSGTIVDNANTYYIHPEHVRGGDLQMHRYDLTGGIGHTITIQRVERGLTGRLVRIDIIQSYMPTLPWVGNGYSELTGYRPDPAAHAGLRRWRRPERRDGRWYMASDESVAVWDSEAAEAPERFAALFAMSAADEVAAMLETIETRRRALYDNPSSCRRREEREAAFENLYELYRTTPELYEELGFAEQPGLEALVPEVDRRHRTLDDFVWSELNYERARTCHWNPSDVEVNREMYRATVAFNVERLAAEGCEALRVFRAEGATYCEGRDGAAAASPASCAGVGDGFDDLRAFGAEQGLRWAGYRNDERGALADVATDELADPDLLARFCAIAADLQPWPL